MRVLLDEHLPADLASDLTGHDVTTVHEHNWTGVTNGVLCQRAAEADIDVLLTNDRGMEHQLNLETLRIGIVVLDAPSNKLGDLRARLPAALEAISQVSTGEVVHVAG